MRCMNEQEVKAAIARLKVQTEFLKQDPQAARKLLQRAGILDESGQVSEHYRRT